MDRRAWEAKISTLLCHPSVSGINVEDIFSRQFDFKNDKRIPAELVCLIADVRYNIWDGSIVNKGPSLLFLRRGFEVGAFPGVWSTIDGVRDIESIEDSVPNNYLSIITVLEEIVEETGIPVSMIEDSIVYIGNFFQPNPDKEGFGFENQVHVAHVKEGGLTPPIQLCYEHTGAVWIPLEVLKEDHEEFLHMYYGGAYDQIKRDGLAPNMDKVLGMLFTHLSGC